MEPVMCRCIVHGVKCEMSAIDVELALKIVPQVTLDR